MLPLLSACYEYKGNYVYSETEEVTVEFPENISAMEQMEDIVFSPKVVSSQDGEISADNPDYEFGCLVGYTHTDAQGMTQRWYDINPEKTKDIRYPAEIPAANYTFWYSVKNRRTGVTHNFSGNLSIISTTSEGWMVLSNNGADRRARLDIIYTDSKGQENVRQDIRNDQSPEVFGGKQIIIDPSLYSTGDLIYLVAESGGYVLNNATLLATEGNTLKSSLFILPPRDEVANWIGIFNAGTASSYTSACVTSGGDAYGVWNSGGSGASFENLLNTDVSGHAATFHVAPFIGTSAQRPGNSYVALFYDKDNKRFVGWDRLSSQTNKLLVPLRNPAEGQLFDFETGMDIVAMKSTRFNDGDVFSVLQDNTGHRHVYGIAVNQSGSSAFRQSSVYHDITAADFDQASDYEFHSQYPLMFYCNGGKVYSYNLATSSLRDQLNLPAGETVTMLKFNLYKQMRLTQLNNQSDEFMDMQYKLIVASTKGGENSGILRFYSIGTDGKMTLYKEYTGLGEQIVDVTYRERR